MTDGMDFSALMAQAQEMQTKMMQTQDENATKTLVGKAAGGKVLVEVNGNGEFQKVEISQELIAEEDAAMISDVVLAAIKDATNQVSELQMQALSGIGLPGSGDE